MESSYYKIASEFISSINQECAIVDESIHDLPDLYCFTYQSKKYMKSKNINDLLVGQGYYFIHKSDKRIFQFSSGFSYEESLERIRKDLILEQKVRILYPKYDIRKKYDITILNPIDALENLLRS